MHTDLVAALKALLAKYSDQPPAEALTIKDFCAAERMSTSSFHKMQRAGLGPEVRRLPGMTMLRISKEAYAAWKKRMAQLQKTEAKQLEQEREVVRAHRRVAGKLAAESPIHVSKRGKRGTNSPQQR